MTMRFPFLPLEEEEEEEKQVLNTRNSVSINIWNGIQVVVVVVVPK